MHWWWSQGIPVLAYPMPAYVDAAQRIGYPADLVSISTPTMLEHAICSIAAESTRSCLQQLVLHGAELASPLNAGLEMLRTICDVARDAQIELRKPIGTIQPYSPSLVKG